MPQITYSGAQIADADSVFQIVTMMKGVVLRGTGTSAVIGLDQPVAGKTGTTNDFNDAWFIGFTPGVLTGCWTGFDRPQSLGDGQTGAAVCAPIWNEFMKTALANQPPVDFPIPPGMTLQQTGPAIEAFKPGQSPGAQSTDGQLAGGLGGTDTDPASATGQPTPSSQSGDTGTKLGDGLY
jgi:penicillin-binding protein 1A